MSNLINDIKNKQPERDELNSKIQDYLSAGNEIEKLGIIKRNTDKPHNFTLHTGNKK